MSDETYRLKKFRKYTCPECGLNPHRPLKAEDTEYDGPFPKPCDHCGRDLTDAPYVIADSMIEMRVLLGREKPSP